MFLFPEPPPIDYYITDVSPTFFSDGIFHYGNPAPTHKFVAKQLKPIKRILSDPVAPVEEIDLRTLNQWTRVEKDCYVDRCGQDDGKIYETFKSMPKWKRDYLTTRRSLYSIFPRSPQYELWYMKDRRMKDFEKYDVPSVECSGKENLSDKINDEPRGFSKPSLQRKNEANKPPSLPVGNINDYSFESLKEFSEKDVRISEKLQLNHPKKYIPGVIHRIQNPEDTDMKDVLDRADAFKVVMRNDIKEKVVSSSEKPNSSEIYQLHATAGCESKWDEDVRNVDKTLFNNDTRWKPLYEPIEFRGTDLERQEVLRKLTKPFEHDLHTWYTKNKPTKFMPPIRRPGKKSLPETHFSHL